MTESSKCKRFQPYNTSSHHSKFIKCCGAVTYDNANDASYSWLIDLFTIKKITSKDYELLLEKEIVKPHTNYICEACLLLVKKSYDKGKRLTKESSRKDNYVNIQNESILILEMNSVI